MPTANQLLVDETLRHAVYVQRYSASVVNKIIALLNRTEDDLVQQLLQRLSGIEARGFDAGTVTTERLKSLLDEVRKINQEAYDEAGKTALDVMRGFAAHETAWQSSIVSSLLPESVTLPIIPTRLVVAATMSRPFQGRILADWFKSLAGTKTARISDAIRMGVVEGQTTQQIITRLRGTKAAGYADGLLDIDRRSAAAVVRTAVNHVSNVAREGTFKDNNDLIKGVQWHATLDGRTCPQCGALDGKLFPVGTGQRPPAHFGCRCTTVPLLKSWKELGIDLPDVPASTRASMNGQVPATQTYEDWLSQQSAAFQDETLGKARGALFRKGGIALSRFTDRNGGMISLEQLKEASPGAFAKADLQ